MFNVSNETVNKFEPATPDAATIEQPVRVAVGGQLHWLRPSNVLRIEVRPANAGWLDRVMVVLSDNNAIAYSPAAPGLADEIAAILWPSAKLNEAARDAA
jgi:hypothetical protein